MATSVPIVRGRARPRPADGCPSSAGCCSPERWLRTATKAAIGSSTSMTARSSLIAGRLRLKCGPTIAAEAGEVRKQLGVPLVLDEGDVAGPGLAHRSSRADRDAPVAHETAPNQGRELFDRSDHGRFPFFPERSRHGPGFHDPRINPSPVPAVIRLTMCSRLVEGPSWPRRESNPTRQVGQAESTPPAPSDSLPCGRPAASRPCLFIVTIPRSNFRLQPVASSSRAVRSDTCGTSCGRSAPGREARPKDPPAWPRGRRFPGRRRHERICRAGSPSRWQTASKNDRMRLPKADFRRNHQSVHGPARAREDPSPPGAAGRRNWSPRRRRSRPRGSPARPGRHPENIATIRAGRNGPRARRKFVAGLGLPARPW